MAFLDASDGVALHYEFLPKPASAPEGRLPALLLHGFAVDAATTWVRSGVAEAVRAAGHDVVLTDLRGHGLSAAPREPSSYALGRFCADLSELTASLGIARMHLVGYSLGARVAIAAAERSGAAIASVVAGGSGASSMDPGRPWGSEEVAAALEAPRLPAGTGPRARAFRSFAQATGADLAALAVLQRAMATWEPPNPSGIGCPVLVVAGKDDGLAGSPEELARQFPRGRDRVVEGNHMNAVLKAAFAAAVVEFLARAENE